MKVRVACTWSVYMYICEVYMRAWSQHVCMCGVCVCAHSLCVCRCGVCVHAWSLCVCAGMLRSSPGLAGIRGMGESTWRATEGPPLSPWTAPEHWLFTGICLVSM